MFESDDYDQILSQIDFPDNLSNQENHNGQNIDVHQKNLKSSESTELVNNKNCNTSKTNDLKSPKNMKRKLISVHFDHKSKRKFPGPAGRLTGFIEELTDEPDNHIQLLSQDTEYSHCHSIDDMFETALWKRLIEDTKHLNVLNTINDIKQQALAGHLQSKKAQVVTAFVEAIDRSVLDPLITLRDATGNIKCTLHRDAWSSFSAYIGSQYCALVLWKPTVLTTGSAFKKHYLNITLHNILTIYSSTIVEEDEQLPSRFTKETQEDFTILRATVNISDVNQMSNNSRIDNLQLLDDLDNVFDEVF